jgi:hypothetical protein
MKNKLILLVFGILFCCKNDNGDVDFSKIYGDWYLNKWEYAHTLKINRFGCISVDNNIDSVFNLSYEIKNDTLYTWNIDKIKHKRKILILNDSVFEIDGFHDNNGIKKYITKDLNFNLDK